MQQAAPSAREAGSEPVPGYRLLEPLGKGGFGEVWKCVAPGGLFKAVKFVRPGDGGVSPAAQELAALQNVKLLRHPFVLSLDRVEVIDDTLVIIMELADDSLHTLAARHRTLGQPGVPRDELLGYLGEAAEALDWMNFDHGLQHLDVKPHNLFVVSRHVKVADFGLVQSFGPEGESGPVRAGGATPLYSAPELLRGTISRTSDQYSLAVVFQQMLTGTVPFWHDNVYDLMMQHLTGDPDLAPLPDGDRAAVRRALSKVPEARFGSCSEFVQELLTSCPPPATLRRSGQWRRIVTGPRPQPSHAHTTPVAAVAPTPVPPTEPRPEPPTRRLRAVPASEARPAAPGAGAAPTCVSLPGYKFLQCVNQTALGDQWAAEDAEGRPRRAMALLGFVRYDGRLISHLRALRDHVLPATEVHWSPAERLVILTEPYGGSLRDRFERGLAAGQSGVPRAELLTLLRSGAEALDGLYSRHGLQHLGLHPRNLLIDGDLVRIADFGLIPLVWLPTGESAASLNGRYSAPELFDRKPSRAADQYSLALIYAEMMTGVHPRPWRPGSGALRPRASTAARGQRLELDLLPAPDREVVARALSPDPANRFPSCAAFVHALEQAGKEERVDLYATLPPVIPFASLMGEPAGPDAVLPAVCELVAAVARPADAREVGGPRKVRYSVLADGSWEYRCPFQLFPGAVALKVEGFRAHWGAQVVKHDGDRYVLEVAVPVARSFWERFSRPKKLEVGIHVEPGEASGARLAEAQVRLSYRDPDPDQTGRVIGQMGPKVLDSVRQFFQATPEQRSRDRVAVAVPVRVYPVLPDLELAEPIEGVTRNLSFCGVSFKVPSRPPVEWMYLHLYSSAQSLGYAVLARLVRCVESEDGFEVGAMFSERGAS